MSDRSTPNNAAFLSDVVRETEWYADQALEMASCHRRASDAYGWHTAGEARGTRAY